MCHCALRYAESFDKPGLSNSDDPKRVWSSKGVSVFCACWGVHDEAVNEFETYTSAVCRKCSWSSPLSCHHSHLGIPVPVVMPILPCLVLRCCAVPLILVFLCPLPCPSCLALSCLVLVQSTAGVLAGLDRTHGRGERDQVGPQWPSARQLFGRLHSQGQCATGIAFFFRRV